MKRKISEKETGAKELQRTNKRIKKGERWEDEKKGYNEKSDKEKFSGTYKQWLSENEGRKAGSDAKDKLRKGSEEKDEHKVPGSKNKNIMPSLN